MKKMIATISFVLGVVALSFAQEATNTAMIESAESIEKGKQTGTYVFVMPQETTEEKVNKMATYYVDYFTVTYDASSREAAIEIVGDVKPSAKVMLRFLSGCGVSYIDVEGNTMTMQDFHQDYLQ